MAEKKGTLKGLTGVKKLHTPKQNTPASGAPKSSITRAGQKKNQTQILS